MSVLYVILELANLCFISSLLYSACGNVSAGNYMFKVNNRKTRTRCAISSRLTTKTIERRRYQFLISFSFLFSFYFILVNIIAIIIAIITTIFIITNYFKMNVNFPTGTLKCVKLNLVVILLRVFFHFILNGKNENVFLKYFSAPLPPSPLYKNPTTHLLINFDTSESVLITTFVATSVLHCKCSKHMKRKYFVLKILLSF